jgi:hypothetical protein
LTTADDEARREKRGLSPISPQRWDLIRKPEFHYRHSWRKGEMIIRDNCAGQHLAIFDCGNIPRRLHRAGIVGFVR